MNCKGKKVTQRLEKRRYSSAAIVLDSQCKHSCAMDTNFRPQRHTNSLQNQHVPGTCQCCKTVGKNLISKVLPGTRGPQANRNATCPAACSTWWCTKNAVHLHHLWSTPKEDLSPSCCKYVVTLADPAQISRKRVTHQCLVRQRIRAELGHCTQARSAVAWYLQLVFASLRRQVKAQIHCKYSSVLYKADVLL